MTAALTIERVEDVTLTPARAEVRLRVAPAALAALPAGVEWRGRLMGPRCRYAATVEVAYPVHPAGPGDLRVIIPEPNWWDPAAPFLYEGPVEAWHAGQLLARATMRHGLRTLRLGPRGLLVNGRPTPLRAAALTNAAPAEDALERLRQSGHNAVLLPPDAEAAWETAWEAADRVGLLVLARAASAAEATRLAAQLTSGRHPSALAGLLPGSLVASPGATPPGGSAPGALWGVELTAPPAAPLPSWVGFVAAPATLISYPDFARPLLAPAADGWLMPAG